MQRASHGVADNETVGKGAVVVSTVSAHSEDLISAPNQNCVLAINLARYQLPVPQILLREACSEIRLRLLCVLVHVVLQKRLLPTVVYIVTLALNPCREQTDYPNGSLTTPTRCQRESSCAFEEVLTPNSHRLLIACDVSTGCGNLLTKFLQASHDGGLTREMALFCPGSVRDVIRRVPKTSDERN